LRLRVRQCLLFSRGKGPQTQVLEVSPFRRPKKGGLITDRGKEGASQNPFKVRREKGKGGRAFKTGIKKRSVCSKKNKGHTG